MKKQVVLLVAVSAIGACGGGDGGDPDAGPDAASPEVTIDGLTGDVDAYFDDHGILHASCDTDEDCAATLGYFHARDRFVQMDVRRRFATGSLTEVVALVARTLALDFSVTNRLVFTTRDGQPLEESVYEAATPKTKGLFEAYARGVNAWIADARAGRNGARLPDEYSSFIIDVPDASALKEWTPTDSVASVMALIEALTNRSEEELALGAIRAQTNEAEFLDLYGARQGSSSVIQPDYVGPSLPAIRAQKASRAFSPSADLLASAALSMRRYDAVGGVFRERSVGSNNWAVGSGRSASGNALLSNDPHLPMSSPALWYVAHLDAKTRGAGGTMHVAGVTFAGIPFVVIGQNEDIAWGATTCNYDLVDAYVETLSEDGNGVRFNGEDVPFITRDQEFGFSDGTSETRTLRWVPHHGPVIRYDEEEGRAVSIRWVGQDVGTDINFLTEMAVATNIEEARSALTNIVGVGQNWVVADRDNNIGWFPYSLVPIRPWQQTYSPLLPIPGDGSAEWAGFVALEDLPQQFNPEAGFIATANNDMTGAFADGDPTNDGFPLLQSFVAPGYRHERIVELLSASTEHTPASMTTIQADTLAVVARQTVPSILDAVDGAKLSTDAQRVVASLTGWGYTCPTGLATFEVGAASSMDALDRTEAAGCTAFHAALFAIEEALIGDEVAALEELFDDGRPDFRPDLRAGIEATVFSLTDPTKLEAGDVYWDNIDTKPVETKSAVVAEALDAAGARLVELLGADETLWRWGDLHQLLLRSDLDVASSGIVTDYNHALVPNDGGLFTVDVADPNEDFIQLQGPSTRLVCEVKASGPDCSIQLPGGQVSFADSTHYDDLLPFFLRNEPLPLRIDIEEVAADAERHIRVGAP